MQYDTATWLAVIRLLQDHGFTVVSEDREQGCLTVKVP